MYVLVTYVTLCLILKMTWYVWNEVLNVMVWNVDAWMIILDWLSQYDMFWSSNENMLDRMNWNDVVRSLASIMECFVHV